jgi:hypothetical protein
MWRIDKMAFESPLCLSFRLSVCLLSHAGCLDSFLQFVCLFVCLSTFSASFCLSVYFQCVFLSVCLLSECLCVCLSACMYAPVSFTGRGVSRMCVCVCVHQCLLQCVCVHQCPLQIVSPYACLKSVLCTYTRDCIHMHVHIHIRFNQYARVFLLNTCVCIRCWGPIT